MRPHYMNPLIFAVVFVVLVFLAGILIGGNLALWVVNQRLDSILEAVR